MPGRESDLVDVAEHPTRRDCFLVRLGCDGLVRPPGGAVVTASEFTVGVAFPATYLRWADPFAVLTWLGPRHVWHPNIAPALNAICVGRLAPGTGLMDLIYQCWEIVTWNKVTMREDDALNWEACQWARAKAGRFPVDRRPLKRRALIAQARPIAPGAATGGDDGLSTHA
jgi:hypothetical protein